MFITKANQKILFIHLFFWLCYCLINAYLWYTFDKRYIDTTSFGLTRLPLKVLAVYINYYLLIKFLFKKKYVLFASFFFVNLFAMGAFQTYISDLAFINSQNFIQFSLPIASVVMVSGMLIISHQLLVKTNESKQREIEQIKSELSFLKSQIQPHFLFNTLNNIYSLTFDDSAKAGQSILQLSALLRYILYETQTEQADLAKEIKHLNDYIELEKIRYSDRLELSFNSSGNIAEKKIATMLLIPFLENAFKHASNNLNQKIWITVDLIVKQDVLFYTVENSVFMEIDNKLANSYGGIGLENVKRRLALLYENYTLNTALNGNVYQSFLMMSLNELKKL